MPWKSGAVLHGGAGGVKWPMIDTLVALVRRLARRSTTPRREEALIDPKVIVPTKAPEPKSRPVRAGLNDNTNAA